MVKEYDPDKRPRLTEEQAREGLKIIESDTPVHLLLNDDSTYSIFVHRHIDHAPCPYCQKQGDARGKPDIEAVLYISEKEYYGNL